MKRHTVIGAEIIGCHSSELLSAARTVALRHHERWDGRGYPDGLAAEQIPPMARVVALADVFDALTSVRPYKRAWSTEQATEHIRADHGKRFEPGVVSAFLEVVPSCLEVQAMYRDT